MICSLEAELSVVLESNNLRTTLEPFLTLFQSRCFCFNPDVRQRQLFSDNLPAMFFNAKSSQNELWQFSKQNLYSVGKFSNVINKAINNW